MSAYKRKLSKGIKWYWKFKYKGIVYFSKAIFLTATEAKKAERLFINNLEKLEKAKEKGELLLFDLIDERLKYLKVHSSKVYYHNSELYLNRIKEHFGNISVFEIKKKELNTFLLEYSQSYKDKGLANHSVNSMIRIYKALFNYAIEYLEIEMINPCRGIKFYSIDKKFKYIPSDDEINALLNVCSPEQRRLVEFVRDTGARISEVMNLRYKDINDNYIVFYTRKSRNSNLTPRKVPKPDCIKDMIGKPDDRVFYHWKEEPKFLFKKLRHLKLYVWGWHCLRHRYASLLSKQGTPIFEISSLLGHSSIQTTQIYLQLLP